MGKSLVLIFHKEENGPLFEKIIIALKAKYRLVSADELEELLLHKKELKNICHISFDDGEKSFYDINFPILKKHKVPVSLFVSPDIINTGGNYWFQEMEGYDEKTLKDILAKQLNIKIDQIRRFSSKSILKCLPLDKIMNVIELYQHQTKCGIKPSQNINSAQLKEMESSGLVTVGAHTVNHPILKNEDVESCHYEITESIKGLETLLGHRVKYFAYPNGGSGIDFGEREMKCLKENEISMAFSAELEHLSADANMLSIPRMGFARMGLPPSNPLVAFRLNVGKKWIDIKSISKPTEKEQRKKIETLLKCLVISLAILQEQAGYLI
jgi:peptidoglycan/xylan/chitin deacetylase (PgdA/CDA1 family)